jgi:hypothetical protein
VRTLEEVVGADVYASIMETVTEQLGKIKPAAMMPHVVTAQMAQWFVLSKLCAACGLGPGCELIPNAAKWWQEGDDQAAPAPMEGTANGPVAPNPG